MPLPYYSFGIKSVQLVPGQVGLVATPEKALFDKIISTSGLTLRSVAQTRDFLMEDLRLDPEGLEKLNLKEFRSWLADASKKDSLSMLIKNLNKL